MTDCNDQFLNAFHDGELSPGDYSLVEAHLLTCGRCAARLTEMRATSLLFASLPQNDLTSDELDRIHAAVDDAKAQPVLRIFTAVSAMAASILIVGAVWLAELSNRPESRDEATAVVAVEPWETVATTLKPTPAEMFEQGHEPATAKATLDEWMLQGISQESN